MTDEDQDYTLQNDGIPGNQGELDSKSLSIANLFTVGSLDAGAMATWFIWNLIGYGMTIYST
jgi:hypothetical protein